MAVQWRRLNNALHRDIGYFFFGMTVIYGLSGIALNHIDDWDPSYIVNSHGIQVDRRYLKGDQNRESVMQLLKSLGVREKYKQHYYPRSDQLKVFLDGGAFTLNLHSGEGRVETVRRRPIFFEVNYLHYNNPKFLWTWFSDIYAGALIVMALTGLFVLRGKNGFRRRGIWFVLVGIVIPAVFLIFYYNSV
jgi:hypothetical protein